MARETYRYLARVNGGAMVHSWALALGVGGAAKLKTIMLSSIEDSISAMVQIHHETAR
jgi:hypothetical protein